MVAHRSVSLRWGVSFVMAFGILASADCGGDSGSNNASMPSDTLRLDALTDIEKGTLCDFSAQKYGGYGHSLDCGGGLTLSANNSKDECIREWPTACAKTVADYKQCATDTSCADPMAASCLQILEACP